MNFFFEAAFLQTYTDYDLCKLTVYAGVHSFKHVYKTQILCKEFRLQSW